MQESSSSQLLV